MMFGRKKLKQELEDVQVKLELATCALGVYERVMKRTTNRMNEQWQRADQLSERCELLEGEVKEHQGRFETAIKQVGALSRQVGELIAERDRARNTGVLLEQALAQAERDLDAKSFVLNQRDEEFDRLNKKHTRIVHLLHAAEAQNAGLEREVSDALERVREVEATLVELSDRTSIEGPAANAGLVVNEQLTRMHESQIGA